MKVWTEEVEVPYWKRGQESATLITPTLKTKLTILGLGFSTPTPPEGITAEVIVFSNFDELKKAGEQGLVKGKIVVYNEEWKGYDDTVSYRSRGAVEAAKRGAVATLVRSVTPYGIRTPHTGFSVRSIPSAAIAIEDATLLNRLYTRHVSNPAKYPAPKVELVLESKLFPKRTSRNVIVELKGQDEVLSKEIVLVGGHIDSWDVGAGAQDDGAGMMVTYEALRIIASLPSHLRPKRTIRTVFFTSEEIGGPGAKAYFNKYSKDPNTKHIFLLESDSGIFNPYGLSLDSKSPSQLQYLQELSKRFVAPNVQNSEGSNIEVGYSGADVEAWCPIAMCVGWVSSGEQYLLEKNRKGTTNSREEYYFWYHHTNGDTMDVVSPHDLGSNSVVIAAYAYAVASLGVPTMESQ
ncbi:hypothetical protein BKA69DRAFT_1103738 [Paraphysoderma sedebokerense]|nr:hypothetical protein BKA69DRAFT_1103738 [Paraphysoderma sedebokerense]